MFQIGGNTFYDLKNKITIKTPEFKRSGIGIITEFCGIPSGFPNQVANQPPQTSVLCQIYMATKRSRLSVPLPSSPTPSHHMFVVCLIFFTKWIVQIWPDGRVWLCVTPPPPQTAKICPKITPQYKAAVPLPGQTKPSHPGINSDDAVEHLQGFSLILASSFVRGHRRRMLRCTGIIVQRFSHLPMVL